MEKRVHTVVNGEKVRKIIYILSKITRMYILSKKKSWTNQERIFIDFKTIAL